MTKIILTGPKDLQDQGFTIKVEPTLLNTGLYESYRSVLNNYINIVPELNTRQPWEYQARYAAMAACRPCNFFAHEQGLGKTFETALVIWAKYGASFVGKQPKLRRGAIQIVAPRHTLNLAWMSELEKTGLSKFAEVIKSELQVHMSKSPIWIIDYDFLKAQTDHGKNLRKLGKSRVKINARTKDVEHYFLGKPMWKLIRRVARPHMVIFDEIHMLREGSDRTDAVHHYVRGVKNRLALTGTPVDGWVAHLASILGVVYGSENRLFPWTSKNFTARFTRERVVDMDYVTGEVGSAGAKKKTAPGINPDQIPEFNNATNHLMHRLVYRDPEVSGHVKFPPVKYHIEKCSMDFDHIEYYQSVHHSTVNLLSNAIDSLNSGTHTNSFRVRQNVLSHLQLLRRASSCPWSVGTGLGNNDIAKIKRLKEICLDAASEGRKVIVFTNFIDTGRVITQQLKAIGLNAVRIYADDKKEKPVHLTQDAREERIEAFLEDPKINVLVGNLALLSTGLTLVQASVVVHYDHDWKANTYKQGNSRVIRPGQVWGHVDIYDLVNNNTVDLYVFNALLQKVKATSEMIDHQFSLEVTGVQAATNVDLDPVAIAKALISGELASH